MIKFIDDYSYTIYNFVCNHHLAEVFGMGRKAVTVLPQTQSLLSKMGEQIRLARLRRRLPSELVAERAFISRQTLTAIEKGSPSVSIGAYAAVLHALGGLERDLLLVAKDDELGRKLQDLGLPQRLRAPRRKDTW
jgi:DNA-binding XRE family transcriptional regulator